MTDARQLIRLSGAALLAAGLLYLPLPFIDAWRGIPDIGGRNWWIAYHMATIHHFFLMFGLFGILAAQLEQAGKFGVAAFVVAALGNAMAGGIGIVQTTMLPALASHADAASGLICTPFYPPATKAAVGFIESACVDWRFDAMYAWVEASWLTLFAGAIAVGGAVASAGVLPRAAGALVALGYAVLLAAFVWPRLPYVIENSGIVIVGLGWAWCGWGLVRYGRSRRS